MAWTYAECPTAWGANGLGVLIMPEFRLPMGSAPDAIRFADLPPFVRGYIEAAFFTDASSADDGELEDATFADLAPDALADIMQDCALFQADNRHLLAVAYASPWEGAARWGDYDAEQAGRDFWFTRNGHGVGFWDRGLRADADHGDGLLANVGDLLSSRCGWRSDFGEVNLYLGDDGRVYH